MAGRDRDYLTIGEVVKSLVERYPDLTVSKIRFLEEKGLISPERTPGGYRQFKENDISRVESILRMQREHFLPLAVIRERLAEYDHGSTPEDLRPSSGTIEPATLPLDAVETVTVGAVTRQTGLPVEFIRELDSFGLITPVGTDDDAELSRMDIEIAHAAWELRRFGVEPRHLKLFNALSEREASLFSRILMPAVCLRTPEARQEVLHQLEELSALTDELKRLLLRRALADTFEDVT